MAEESEFSAAAALRAEMALEMGSDLDAIDPAWRERYREYFGGRQQQGRGAMFLAFDGGQAVGMTAVTLADEWRTHCFGQRFAHVNAVFVRASHRRRGIARELMNRAIGWARERGCLKVRLRTSDQGRALYESLGFVAGREMERDL